MAFVCTHWLIDLQTHDALGTLQPKRNKPSSNIGKILNPAGAQAVHVTHAPPSYLQPRHGVMPLRSATASWGTRERDNVAWAENLFLPLHANVCFVPRNERVRYLISVLVLSSRPGAADIFRCVGIDRPPKYLLFGGG